MFDSEKEMESWGKTYDRIIFQEIKRIRNSKVACLYSECSRTAINCHWLQRKGILDKISHDNHLYELVPKSTFEWNNCGTVSIEEAVLGKIEKRGINEAFSSKIFCADHDTSLFKSIESQQVNLYNYNAQVLLSYRAICAELRACEYNQVINTVLSEKFRMKFSPRINEKLSFTNAIFQEEVRIRFLTSLKKHAENEIKFPNNQYEFCTIPVHKLPIAVCTLFRGDFSNPLFLHVIPLASKSLVIIGYKKSPPPRDSDIAYIKGWLKKDASEISIECTNIILKSTTNFCMSPEFFYNLTLDKENLLTNAHSMKISKLLVENPNLFN